MPPPSGFPLTAAGAFANTVAPALIAFGLGQAFGTQPVHFAKERQRAHDNKKENDNLCDQRPNRA
jgi:hypothetical protein